MVPSVHPGEVPEGHVVRAGGVLSWVVGAALVVRIVGHEVPAMHVGGQLQLFLHKRPREERQTYHEGRVHDHLDDGLGLRLDPVIKIRPLRCKVCNVLNTEQPYSHPQQMVVLLDSLVDGLVEVREVPIQVNIIAVISSNKIILSVLQNIKRNFDKEGRYKTDNVSSGLPAVRVHAGKEVDPGGVDQLLDVLVTLHVRLADVVGEVEKELSSQHLVRS